VTSCIRPTVSHLDSVGAAHDGHNVGGGGAVPSAGDEDVLHQHQLRQHLSVRLHTPRRSLSRDSAHLHYPSPAQFTLHVDLR